MLILSHTQDILIYNDDTKETVTLYTTKFVQATNVRVQWADKFRALCLTFDNGDQLICIWSNKSVCFFGPKHIHVSRA